MQSKLCPLCKTPAHSGMGKLSNYWFCQNCTLGWIKKIPSTSYEDEYYASGSSLLAKLFTPIELFFYKVREKYVGILSKNIWIDVGAGDGNFLATVNARKKIGVEISKSGRNKMQKKGLFVM